jgi:tetratricopeptide (TPR) repeat protein
MDTASGAVLEPKLASAAARALERAVDDAPCHVELMEALAALQLRLGHPRDAERRLNAALAIAPKRMRLHALLAQALREQSQFDAALAALRAASALGDDPNLAAERGLVLAACGDLDGAAVAWREALSKSPVHPTAFVRLGSLAVRAHDAVAVQSLVDGALVTAGAHPDVLRCAIQLALATESEGIARAARIARLCGRVLEVVPDDVWTGVALAKSLLVLGDPSRAHARLAEIERIAPESAPAAEAQLVRLAIRDAGAELELRAVARAARIASPDELAEVAVRARRLATLHGGWLGWFALAVAERRRGRAAAARGALHVALEVAPGASGVHIELTDVLISLGDPKGALEHARRALLLEGETPRGLVALGRAQAAAGRTEEARDAATRALALEAANDLAQELLERLSGDTAARTWGQKLRASLLRRKK